MWKDGKVLRSNESYSKWAKEASESENALFIDLNELTAAHYEKIGRKIINDLFFLEDHTHTTMAGAHLNALIVAQSLDTTKQCGINKFLTNVYKVNTK
jgi:lysophospholipase L1-like esterase